jgi:polysaccharide pyruvyl transferase WcaK-like protein
LTSPDPATERGAAAPRGRVYLVGYYGVDNLGDEAIRWAIERAATALGVDVVRYATRDERDADPRAVPIRLRAAHRHLAAIRAADRVVLGGGGILKDEGLRLPLELAATALVARLLGRRVTLLGVGVGPFYRRLGRWLVRLTARLAQVRTVRDDASAMALADLGIGRVQVGADPIFTSDSDPDGRRTAAMDATADPPGLSAAEAPHVVVSVRPWFHKALDATAADVARDRLRGAVAAAVGALAERGAGTRSVSLYWPRDRDEAALVGSLVAGAVDAMPDAGRLDWPGLLAELAAADLVIAMRYHAVAAAALAGRPVIALAYESKVAELGQALGIPTLDVAAPDLRESLLEAVGSWQRGSLPPPDPVPVDGLRAAAWRSVRAALLD